MGISRRALAGFGALFPAAGLGLFSPPLAAADALAAQRPQVKRGPGIACDVLVIGAGAAGLAAAIAAREAGAEHVILAEKTALAGGHLLVSSGMLNALDPEGQKRAGRTDSPEQFFRDTYEGGGGLGDPELISVMVRQSSGILEWLRELGVVFEPHLYEAYTGVYPRAHRTTGSRSGYDYVRALMRRARVLGVEIRYQTRALRLEKNDAGRLQGVTLLDSGGAEPAEIFCRTGAAVIASGGFGASLAMRSRWAPQVSQDLETTYSPGRLDEDPATGDGIAMAEAAGAALTGMEHVLAIPFWGGRVLDYPGAEIFLTLSGARFTDETASWDVVLADLMAAGGSDFWVITDSQSRKGATFATKVQQGLVESAESLSELADKMHLRLPVLERVLARYNEAARTGVDPDFGRMRFLQELREPPFYFGRERFEVHYTCGGIVISPQAEVMRPDGTPLPGLYAAGEASGGLHGKFRLGGNGILDAFVFGRIAGANAARSAARI